MLPRQVEAWRRDPITYFYGVPKDIIDLLPPYLWRPIDRVLQLRQTNYLDATDSLLGLWWKVGLQTVRLSFTGALTWQEKTWQFYQATTGKLRLAADQSSNNIPFSFNHTMVDVTASGRLYFCYRHKIHLVDLHQETPTIQKFPRLSIWLCTLKVVNNRELVLGCGGRAYRYDIFTQSLGEVLDITNVYSFVVDPVTEQIFFLRNHQILRSTGEIVTMLAQRGHCRIEMNGTLICIGALQKDWYK